MTTESDAATLVDGTRLSPQQLGLMGMEALETVVGYWEDALAAYRSVDADATSPTAAKPPPLMLTTQEELNFMRLLESILEGAYQLQEESESIFIHQNSILNRDNNIVLGFRDASANRSMAGGDGGGSIVSGRGGNIGSMLLSVSTVDNDSFVSAQDTIADMGDFEDVIDFYGEDGPASNRLLYLEALEQLDRSGIPYRALRTDFVGCATDSEYLAKLHCLRIAFREIMADDKIRKW
jgi:hypothetical protein